MFVNVVYNAPLLFSPLIQFALKIKTYLYPSINMYLSDCSIETCHPKNEDFKKMVGDVPKCIKPI